MNNCTTNKFKIEKSTVSDNGTTYIFTSCDDHSVKCALKVTKKEEIVPECKCIINDINLIAINNKDNLAVIEENGIKTYTYSFKEETNEEDFKISLIFDKNNKCDNCEENTQVEKISTEPTITGHSVSVICGESFEWNGSPSYTATTTDHYSDNKTKPGGEAKVTWSPNGNNNETNASDRTVTVKAEYHGKTDTCTTTQKKKPRLHLVFAIENRKPYEGTASGTLKIVGDGNNHLATLSTSTDEESSKEIDINDYNNITLSYTLGENTKFIGWYNNEYCIINDTDNPITIGVNDYEGVVSCQIGVINIE